MVSPADINMIYAQLQQYHIHSSNYIYSTLFFIGIILLTFTAVFMLKTSKKLKSLSDTTSSGNFVTGSNPSMLAHFLAILYCLNLIILGYLGIHQYYYELSPVLWTKLFNQVVICNGSSSHVNYVDSSFYKYRTTLHEHDTGTKTALLLSIENFIGNHTYQGKDVSKINAFAMSDGSLISENKPLLLDYRNLFSRHYPFIYFTISEQMKTYLKIGLFQFSSFSFFTSTLFITLSSLRASLLTYFDATSTGLLSSSSFILMNMYGISRLIIFPIIDIWTNGTIQITNAKIIDYIVSFDIESFHEDEKKREFSWILGCLKHYLTIIERIIICIILFCMLGKLKIKKSNANSPTSTIAFTPEEIIPFLFLFQPRETQTIRKSDGISKPTLYLYLNILKLLLCWNILSHIAIFSLSLSFKQLSLLQYPILADFLSLSVIISEFLCIIAILCILNSLNETSNIFWRTPSEQESDTKYINYARCKYSEKLDINSPEDLDERFQEINSTSSISRAIYKPPIDFELPVWAKEANAI